MYVRSHQTLKKYEFYPLLSVADLAVITPLTRWDEHDEHGESTNKRPSVLSEFMGM